MSSTAPVPSRPIRRTGDMSAAPSLRDDRRRGGIGRLIRSAATMLSAAVLFAPPVTAQTAPAAATIIGPGLRTTDLDRATRFYTEGLGMTLARRIDTAGGTELMFGFGATPRPPIIMLFTHKGGGPVVQGDGYGRTMLAVPDAAGLAARLKAAGYAPGAVEENGVNGMKTFWVKDPDGYAYEITQRPVAAR